MLLAFGMAGCAAGVEHRSPAIELSPTYRLEPVRHQDPDSRWWSAYRNGFVDELVERGLSRNIGIQQALQRVVEARARLRSVAAGAIGGDGRVTGEAVGGHAVRSQFGREAVLQAGLATNAAWQMDLFGNLQRQREAAAAQFDIAEIDIRAAQLQFVAELVDAAIDALTFREGEAVARQSLASQRRLVATLKERFSHGETTTVTIARAEALMHATSAQLPAFEAGYQNALGRLSVLLDEPAAAFDRRLRRMPALPLPATAGGAGRPADLLRRRPDIRRAERALAAATAEAGAAEAELYPSVTLRGAISLTDLVANVATAGRFGASIGPHVTIPTLDLPRLTANAEAARSVIESRHLDWRRTVLTAIAEVDGALARLRAARQSVGRLDAAVQANQRAARLMHESLALGAATHGEVIDVERALALSREQLVNGRQQVAKAFAQLHIALAAGSEAWLVPGQLRYRHIADHRPLPSPSDGLRLDQAPPP